MHPNDDTSGWLSWRFAEEYLPSFVPIAVASVIAFWPGERPERKILFVFVSAALCWGIPIVFYVLQTPFEFYAVYVEPTLRDEGYHTIPGFVFHVREYLSHLYIGFLALLSVFVPIIIRNRFWPLIFSK